LGGGASTLDETLITNYTVLVINYVSCSDIILNSGIQIDQISSHIRLKYKIHRLSRATLCWTVSGHATFLVSSSNLIGYIMVVGVESPYCLCPNSKHSLVPVTTATTGYVSIKYVQVFYFHYYRVEVCMQIMQSQHTYNTIYCHHLEYCWSQTIVLLITNNQHYRYMSMLFYKPVIFLQCSM